MIPLGFEVGSGSPIHIPVGHMVIVGQSQRSGKTTALEACATRSNAKCIAFLTKRGEGSFRLAREISPYYEDQVDWRTVRTLGEALTEERWSPEESRNQNRPRDTPLAPRSGRCPDRPHARPCRPGVFSRGRW